MAAAIAEIFTHVANALAIQQLLSNSRRTKRPLAVQCQAVSEPRSSLTCVPPPNGSRTVIRLHEMSLFFADALFSELEWIRPMVFEDHRGVVSDSTVEANRRTLTSTEFRDKRHLRVRTVR